MKAGHAAVKRTDVLATALADFLRMVGVAFLGGLFFSLVVGLVVFLIASDAYAGPPREEPHPVVEAIGGRDFSGEVLLLDRNGASAVAVGKIETDVYAQVGGDSARTRLTQTFRSGGYGDAWYVLTFPEGTRARHFIAAVRDDERDEVIAGDTRLLVRSLGSIATGEEVSVVVELEQTVSDAAPDRVLRLPCVAQAEGAVNLLLDLEPQNAHESLWYVRTAFPGAQVERNAEHPGAYVVSAATERAVPRDFELRWAARTNLAIAGHTARSARVTAH